ncbi:hypothetical protein S1OALGB6SA_266 [Olavius algarvensis spirochete endosymbiont]|nr:hypothetical protein S1OALGB6SA_266 [Olavius algarvensis spirochete endosymbiont]
MESDTICMILRTLFTFTLFHFIVFSMILLNSTFYVRHHSSQHLTITSSIRVLLFGPRQSIISHQMDDTHSKIEARYESDRIRRAI